MGSKSQCYHHLGNYKCAICDQMEPSCTFILQLCLCIWKLPRWRSETEREAGVTVGVAWPSAETMTGSAIQSCCMQMSSFPCRHVTLQWPDASSDSTTKLKREKIFINCMGGGLGCPGTVLSASLTLFRGKYIMIAKGQLISLTIIRFPSISIQ